MPQSFDLGCIDFLSDAQHSSVLRTCLRSSATNLIFNTLVLRERSFGVALKMHPLQSLMLVATMSFPSHGLWASKEIKSAVYAGVVPRTSFNFSLSKPAAVPS